MTELARVMTDFQGQPRAEGQIPNTLTSMLATQSFPVNGPVSLEDAADYGGYKIFTFEARLLCFSRFEYKGARDDYDRAIPSARILVIPLETLRYHRDFELLCELVASDLPLEEMAQRLERLDMETTRTQALERLSAKSSYPAGQLAALMADLCTRRRLVIAGNNGAARTSLFGLLFLILPVEVIAQMTWCTYGDFLSENQESLLGSAQKVVAPSGLWSKLGARLLGTKGQIPLVDAADGSLSIALSLNGQQTIWAELFKGLLTDRWRGASSQSKSYKMYQDLLSHYISKRPMDLDQAVRPGAHVT